MKKENIKKHLKPYSIYQKRKSTINHAFASALSLTDEYDSDLLNRALGILEQCPEEELLCVYCDKNASTWDHLNAVVQNSEFSGYGHQVFNLVPCCSTCNSLKGNMYWKEFLEKYNLDSNERISRIAKYISNISAEKNTQYLKNSELELDKYKAIKMKVFELMKEADELAIVIRGKMNKV